MRCRSKRRSERFKTRRSRKWSASGILGDSAAVRSCLEVVAKESERVAFAALEKGSALLEEGLAILDGQLELPDSGYVN